MKFQSYRGATQWDVRAFVTTHLRYVSSYGISSTYYLRHLASNVPIRKLAVQKRKHNRKPKNRILNYRIYITISYLNLVHIILYLLMDTGVIRDLYIGGLAGYCSARHRSRCREFSSRSTLPDSACIRSRRHHSVPYFHRFNRCHVLQIIYRAASAALCEMARAKIRAR